MLSRRELRTAEDCAKSRFHERRPDVDDLADTEVHAQTATLEETEADEQRIDPELWHGGHNILHAQRNRDERLVVATIHKLQSRGLFQPARCFSG